LFLLDSNSAVICCLRFTFIYYSLLTINCSLHPYIQLAHQTIKHYLATGDILSDLPADLPPEAGQRKAGVFVSLHQRKTHDLRGCIGTISPCYKSITQEIIHNALSAAFRDPRFDPLQPEELAGLEINVDVLSEPESIDGRGGLDPKQYGVIVSMSDGRGGVLLPDLPGVDTVDRQLQIACQKAGIDYQSEYFAIERFTVVRY